MNVLVLTALAGAAAQDIVEDRFQGNTAKFEHPPSRGTSFDHLYRIWQYEGWTDGDRWRPVKQLSNLTYVTWTPETLRNMAGGKGSFGER